MKEQAIRLTYGRVGTYEESKEYTENETIFSTLGTLNTLTVILKSHINQLQTDNDRFVNPTITIFRLTKNILT